MSHVLGLHFHTPGKYELKYKLTTLIYPFTKQRTSSWARSSGEIAWLLFFPQSLRELTGVGMARWLGDCGPRGSTQIHARTHINTACSQRLFLCGSIPPLWALLSVEDRTRGSSDGSQAEFHEIREVMGGGGRTQHVSWGTYGRSSVSQHQVWDEARFEARIFWFRLLDIICVNGEQKE